MSKSSPDVTGIESKRKSRGRSCEGASFPVPTGKNEMPAEYAVVLGELKNRIQSERLRVTIAANSAMVLMYWDLGKVILDCQKRQGWGAKVIDRLSHDLKIAFPDMSGFSPRNLKYMRKFAEVWPKREIVQGSLAQITWYHNIALLEKISEPETRLWYAHMIFKEGWSRNILAMQIELNLHKRQGKAINNFDMALHPAGARDCATHRCTNSMAQQSCVARQAGRPQRWDGSTDDDHQEEFRGGGSMTKLLKRLPADNEKLQPLVGEISWGKNLIFMAGGKDNLKREFYHVYRELPKVQPLVAQIGWSHNLIIFQRCKDHLERELEVLNAEVAVLAATIKKNFEVLGI